MAAQSVTVLQPRNNLQGVQGGDFFGRIERLQDQIARRAFEIFEAGGGLLGHDLDHWLQAESELLHPVHIHLTESDDALTLQAEVPGFSARELEISVEPRRVTITGKRESREERKNQRSIYQERCSDEILRVIDLPAEINSEKVKAMLENGILSVEMPKAAAAKKITVQAKTA
jgi:HSP20 family protein